MKLDVLVIAAHPDDAELSCGGTVIKLVKQGRKVGLLDLTDGELGTRGTKEIRAAEARDAAACLGVTMRESVSLPDGDIVNTYENRQRVIQVIRKYTPELLLIPYHTDRHPDHEHAHVLARESWFYAGLSKLETSLNGTRQEPFRPRAYYCFMQWFEFSPSFIVDVSDEFEQRMKAAKMFKSQFFNPESRERETALSTPGFLDMIETRYRHYGDRIGVTYGEPFFSPMPIKVDDIVGLNV